MGAAVFNLLEIEALACKFPAIWGVNIDSRLRPAVAWLEGCWAQPKTGGQGRCSASLAVLGCSIE